VVLGRVAIGLDCCNIVLEGLRLFDILVVAAGSSVDSDYCSISLCM